MLTNSTLGIYANIRIVTVQRRRRCYFRCIWGFLLSFCGLWLCVRFFVSGRGCLGFLSEEKLKR